MTAPPAAAPGAGRSAVRRPAPAAKRGGSRERAPARGPGAARRGKSNSAALIAGAAVLAVAAIIGIVVATKGGGGYRDQGPSPAAKTPGEQAAEAIEAAGAARRPSTAVEAWTAAEKLFETVEVWTAERQPLEAISEIRKRAIELREASKDLDPDFEPYRRQRGEVRYGDRLAPLVDAGYLTDVERRDAARVHDAVARIAERNHGWIPGKEMERVAAIEERFREKREAHEGMLASPFYSQATAMIDGTLAELEQRMADVEEGRWIGAEVRIVEPFVFFVQKDPGWDALQVATAISEELIALQTTIINDFEDMNLKPVDTPVPVLYFRNHRMYQAYAKNAGTGAMAHFEPLTGRMAIHDSSDHTTRQHEGTHQLMWFWTQQISGRKPDHTRMSYWFQEGLAEWYSSSSRSVGPEGKYIYESGLLDSGRMRDFKQWSPGRPTFFDLQGLIATTYGDREKIGNDGRTGYIYSQGWFFIYFLNHFSVNDREIVQVGAKGKYADGFKNYVRAELSGRTGTDVFMEALKIDEQGLRAMREEFWRFSAFVLDKAIGKRLVRKKLLPLKEYREWLLREYGEDIPEEEDLLPPMPGYAPEPWWQ